MPTPWQLPLQLLTNHKHQLPQIKSSTNNQQWPTTISLNNQTNGSSIKAIKASTKRSQAIFQNHRNLTNIGD
jgi:hypothetical protein